MNITGKQPMVLIRKSETDQQTTETQPQKKDRLVRILTGSRKIALRVYFEIDGKGDFSAGGSDTASGISCAWIRPQTVLSLEARPAPGHTFSHWIVQKNFAGCSRKRRVAIQQGMVIRAVFKALTGEEMRC